MLIMLCHCLCLSICVCALCVWVVSLCVSVLRVLSVQFCLVCYALLSFSCFCVFNKRSGPALSHTHTHVHVDSPPCTPFPLLAITMTSRFYDFDICFRLLLCMQMTLALMVTQMIVGCCMVTVGADRAGGSVLWMGVNGHGAYVYGMERECFGAHTRQTHTHTRTHCCRLFSPLRPVLTAAPDQGSRCLFASLVI